MSFASSFWYRRGPMSFFRSSSDTCTSKGGSWLGSESVDRMIEIGGVELRPPVEKDGKHSFKKKSKAPVGCSVQRWISNHRIEVLGITLVLVGAGVVLAGFLFPGLFNFGGKEENDIVDAESDLSSATRPPRLGNYPTLSMPRPAASTTTPSTASPTKAPLASPTKVPLALPTPAPTPVPIGPIPATLAPSRGPTYESVFHRLSLVVDASLLNDPETPQGMAYHWIKKMDDLRWSPDHPSLVQRFILATFYFATGGRRTTATWKVCSAVPSELVDERNAFSTRCIFDDDRTICAARDDFLECPEYYERFSLVAPPDNPKKRWLSGVSECDWYGVFCNGLGNVEQLALPNNGLQGTLISELGILADFSRLNLGGNQLTGTLPAWDTLTKMEHLSLYDNSFMGSIPWQGWTNLETLDLARNNLTGTVNLPENWIHLQTLVLSDNQLELSMTPRIGLWTDLQTLDVSGNSIGGRLPGSMGNWKKLMQLNLANCQVTGHIPPEIGALTNLVELQLQHNSFNGTLPIGLWDLTHLQHLRLEDNQFSGTLSSAIGQLVGLQELSLAETGLSGGLPGSLGDLVSLEWAHLQFNSFEGAIPEALCQVPTLVDLRADCEGSSKLECSCCTQCCSFRKDEYQCYDQ